MTLNALSRAASILVIACLAGMCAVASEDPARRAAPPQNLMEEQGQWKVQMGDWQLTKGGATTKAGETLAELSAIRGTRLPGRWLSLKLTVEGEVAKAGVWFSGVRDSRGEILRCIVDRGSGNLVTGRGKVLGALGVVDGEVEILLRFDADKVSVFRGGAMVADVPLIYSEEEATISLFAERGTAHFREVLLSAPAVMAGRADSPVTSLTPVVPEPPKRGRRPVPAARAGDRLPLDLPGAQSFTLKSGWNDYFAVHFETANGPWKAVRQFDGPGFSFPAKERHTGDVKTYDGPFARHPVQASLADFRDWKRKDARGLDENLKALIETDRSALFIAPWASPFTLLQQDHVWALMKLVYGANVGAEGRVFFQWGDDINHRRLGVMPNARITGFEPRGGSSAPRGSNVPADAVAYAENYFAPAVEAVRLASEEIFRDARHIPVLLGSCARASATENRDWYAKLLEHELIGTYAASLKGKKVIELVDFLTVNYPFHGVHDASALQELWQRYGAKVKGLWVTEEYGSTSRGAGVFLERLALYLEWVGANQLTAEQTRLFWNLPLKQRDDLIGLARRLGDAFAAAPLELAKVENENSRIFRVRGGENLVLFIHVPAGERRGRKGTPIAELAWEPPAALAGRSWEARFIISKDRKDDGDGMVVPIDRKDGKHVIPIEATTRDTWGLLLRASDAPNPAL